MTDKTAPVPSPIPAELRTQVAGVFSEATDWIQAHWLAIGVSFAIGVAIVLALHVVRGWGLRLCRRGEGVANWYSILGRAIGKTGHFFIVMTAARLVIGYANAPWAIFRTVAFLFTVAAAFQAALWVREIVFGAVEHRTRDEDYPSAGLASALGIIRLIVSIVLFSIATVVVLSNLGVNVTGLVAGLGVGGIAIGLAAQGIFGDLFAALAIIFDKPFRVGDVIAYDKGSGTVEAIGLKSTRVRGVGGEQRIIANRKLLDFEILNNSRRDVRRLKLVFGLIYQTPADKLARVPDILRALAEANGAVFRRAAFTGFGANALDFEFEFELESADFATADAARHRIGLAMVERFAAEDIAFFSPVRPELPPKA
ncbi:mechanosensitive ion channel family protein [Sphingomonas canadensis]|uniref:Mechanosensitive ion channel family protein n=1 Tax=Sphingomonas canadensis TaxID=1219257 RepID=A0ABW3H4I5_9SPHN|nr:mechanosensitive ion channel family protein [Sphingomonas canadensis]MCW3836111.1 mechanosensitive ion channel family protein [Sphingomonas canadensis]